MEAHLQIPKLMEMFKKHVPGFENCYLSSINASIGVRESRRVKGLKMLDYHDAVARKEAGGYALHLCGYFIDIHNGAGARERIVLPLKSLLESPMDAWYQQIFTT